MTMMDNAPLMRKASQDISYCHSVFSLRLKLMRDPSGLRVTAIRGARSSMQLSVNEDALAIQSFLSSPVYKKQWFLPHRASLVLCHASEELLKKERSRCCGPFFCKEYGLVCAEVHFCQDTLGFHGALDERDHTELSGE